VQVDGTAEVLDVPEAVEPLMEYFRSISGEHPDWDEYRQAMVRQGKSLLRVTPARWGAGGDRRLPAPAGPARLASAPRHRLKLHVPGRRWQTGGMTGSDPKTDLHRYLQDAREALLWKLDGLTEYNIRRPMVPPAPTC
jgi:Protein of unknown function (DUF664).